MLHTKEMQLSPQFRAYQKQWNRQVHWLTAQGASGNKGMLFVILGRADSSPEGIKEHSWELAADLGHEGRRGVQ